MGSDEAGSGVGNNPGMRLTAWLLLPGDVLCCARTLGGFGSRTSFGGQHMRNRHKAITDARVLHDVLSGSIRDEVRDAVDRSKSIGLCVPQLVQR